MEIKTFLIENFAILLTSIFGGGSFYGYFVEKRKNIATSSQEESKAKQEEFKISQEESTALSAMRRSYKEFTEDMNEKYDFMANEVSGLKKKLTDVSTELDQEKGKYTNLKKAYDSLKREFDNYKKKHNI